MRYSRQDDILLAKYFVNKPEGTSDKIFQMFARLVSPTEQIAITSLIILSASIRITPGRAGKNTTGYTKSRSTISSNDCPWAKTSITRGISRDRRVCPFPTFMLRRTAATDCLSH